MRIENNSLFIRAIFPTAKLPSLIRDAECIFIYERHFIYASYFENDNHTHGEK